MQRQARSENKSIVFYFYDLVVGNNFTFEFPSPIAANFMWAAKSKLKNAENCKNLKNYR